MIYLTKGYTIKDFETKEEALEYIKQDLEQHKLNYKLVFSTKEKDIEILVYQYHTLYTEIYMLHTKFDLRDRGEQYE